MHNVERYLRSAVLDLLELAHEISSSVEVVIVDDGSTDETFETACELSRMYPQIKVLRQTARQGLAATLALVGNHLSPEVVVVHDGISAIDAHELKTLLAEDPQGIGTQSKQPIASQQSVDSVGSRRFSSLRSLQQSMEKANRRVSSFSWIRLEKPMIPRRSRANFAPAFTSASPSAIAPLGAGDSSTIAPPTSLP